MAEIFVLTNPAGVGVGLPLGVYSTLERAIAAGQAFAAPCRVQQLILDDPADYAASETVLYWEGLEGF